MGDEEGMNIGSLYYKLPSSEEFLPVGNVSDAHFDLTENTEDNTGEWVEPSTESISFDVKVSDVHVDFLNRIRYKQRVPRKLKKKMKKDLSKAIEIELDKIRFTKYIKVISIDTLK